MQRGEPDPTPVVRVMLADEIEAVLDVFEAVAAEGLWMGTEAGFDRVARAEAWRGHLADPATRMLVVVDPVTGALLGEGNLRLAGYGVAGLGMFLAADARGHGLGGLLLDRLLDAAVELGAHKVDLQVWPHNAAAIGLYRSRGFVVEGRLRAHYPRGNGQVWDAIVMGRLLDPALVRGERASELPDAASLPATLPITP